MTSGCTYPAPDPSCAQAYAYAGGRPLVNVDPTGSYWLDGSWRHDPGPRAVAQGALAAIRSSDLCRCSFRHFFGREPFDDPAPIGYVAAGAFGVYGITQGGGVGQSLLLPGTAGIFITQNAIAGGLAKTRETLAHEISHFSFGTPEGTSPPSWNGSARCMGAACDGIPSDYGALNDPTIPIEIRKCVRCFQ